MSETAEPLLRPGETCRTMARAGRASLLIDGRAYFEALRAAMLKARRSIHIVGWDIDSRVDLAPHLADGRGRAPDGAPTRLKPLLEHIAKRHRGIEIKLLLWDFTMLYAADREPLPRLNLDWSTPPQIEVCLDDVLPLGASHHQKLVVVDDAVAFCGGLDLTARRWDTPEHAPDEPLRRAPDGQPYDAFHDVQMMIDGEAAKALAKIAHERWHEASCTAKRKVMPRGDPWPEAVAPDFRDVDIGLALTVPALHERPEERHVERLYIDAIARAERSIYIENQYLTAPAVADALARRLDARPDLDVVMVTPKAPSGWLEAKSMGAGRVLFAQRLAAHGMAGRVAMVYPGARDDSGRVWPVNVHAKLMIVDDTFLTVGSANLNNRSMGFDTEANLAIEARDADRRRTVARVRDRLLGEHLGLSADEVADRLAGGARPTDLIEASRDGNRALLPVDDASAFGDDPIGQVLVSAADPERPIDLTEMGLVQYQPLPAMRPRARRLWIAFLLAVFAGLAMAWTYTPLAQFTEIERLRPLVAEMQGTGWAAALVVGLYVLAGLAVFPVTVLITLTALVFPPPTAFAYAVAGVVASAAATYALGWIGGRRFLRRLIGRRLNAISRELGRKGILAVIALRAAPIAPFSLVNMVAGASHISLRDFLIGTALGMAPGIAVLTAAGESLWALLVDPTPGQVAVVAVIVAAWLGLGVGLQKLVDRLGRGGEREK